MNLKNILLVLFLVVFNSCALSLKVGEKSYPPNTPNLINAETLSYSQLRWKLRTDFQFRYDYAQYAMSQPQSFDWNNPLLNNRYNFYNPYLGYSYFGGRTQMWNDWLWGFTPYRWSPFGYDRWGYNNLGWNNYYGWDNYYGWNNWNTWNSHLNPNWGKRGSTTTRNSRAHASMIQSTKLKRRNTNVTPIPNNIRVREIRNSEDRVIKPRIIRTKPNNPVIRNNPPNRNIRVNPPSRPSINSRPQTQSVRRKKRNN